MTKDEFRESYKNFLKNKGLTRAFYDPLSRENVFSKSAKSYDYGHELMHNLRRYTKNDYVLASAVETYMRSLDQARVYVEEGRINEAEDLYKKIRHQENLKPLSFLHRILNQEYSNKFDETGRDIGRRAAFMEARYKLPRAGLQYLKLIDNKVSPEKAEKIVIMMNDQNLSLV